MREGVGNEREMDWDSRQNITFAPKPMRPTQCSYFLCLGVTPIGYRIRCHTVLFCGAGKGRGGGAKAGGSSLSSEFGVRGGTEYGSG
jgi:hypothetical protein